MYGNTCILMSRTGWFFNLSMIQWVYSKSHHEKQYIYKFIYVFLFACVGVFIHILIKIIFSNFLLQFLCNREAKESSTALWREFIWPRWMAEEGLGVFKVRFASPLRTPNVMVWRLPGVRVLYLPKYFN